MSPMRRNVAHLSQVERDAFVAAVRQADVLVYSDGVSYWDKQDQIHQVTHHHGGPTFIPWHRELCNRFEKLLQQGNPDVALHYWDWTQDPRSASNGLGGTVNLTTDSFFGTANGMVAGVLAPLHNGGGMGGSREATGNPADPPRAIERNCNPGAPGLPSDAALIDGADGLPQANQWAAFRVALESAHDAAHTFFGFGSNIFNPHRAFEDPFVFLLHSNVDRLFAMWQAKLGFAWRLDPALVYGSESNSGGSTGILATLAPWDGTALTGAPIHPWTAGSSEIVAKNSRHSTIVRPPCYDTLPLTVEQVAPIPGEPLRFVDAIASEQTARAMRLRVRGCRQVTCNGALAADAAFSLRTLSVLSPEPEGFETHDVLTWVLFDAGGPGSSPGGTLTVTAVDSGDVFNAPIVSNVIAKPTVAGALVLDTSGSMSAASGVPGLTRMNVLHNAAPLFVQLLDDADGIGVVRFDTDASVAQPIEVAGGLIGGLGRSNALGAIVGTVTNLAGLTAIGDGIEAGSQILTAAPGFQHRALVVFTDGHETADKRISQVTDMIDSRVFAVGLGTAEQLNPGALKDIADSTGGYLLLTGNAGPDDQILLQKYFAQILAGVTNAEIIVDPPGFVLPGSKTVVPFDVGEADRRLDGIVLSPYSPFITFALTAPDGTLIDEANGATAVGADNFQALRLPLPNPILSGDPAGTWRAILSIEDAMFDRLLDHQQQFGKETIERLRQHGVPFIFTAQARSSVRMDVEVSQPSRVPGSIAGLSARLSQAGIPLQHAASLVAEITLPNGSVSTVPLAEGDEALFTAEVLTPVAGVYRVRFRCAGTTVRGIPFTREALRTLAVWSRGNDRGPDTPSLPADSGGLGVCGLLECLVDSGALEEAAGNAGIDLDRVRDCLKRHCR